MHEHFFFVVPAHEGDDNHCRTCGLCVLLRITYARHGCSKLLVTLAISYLESDGGFPCSRFHQENCHIRQTEDSDTLMSNQKI